ncbi:MAG: hypothetical protein A07HB70_00906 [uncultured archaeon A07HB70]|nr:MAG: hypothetical protein A07HB70_00906 [uncultured archaeon A07HB70]
MVDAPATAAAAVAVVLFGTALVAMTGREFQVAGFCFLSAALVIYVRERFLVD